MSVLLRVLRRPAAAAALDAGGWDLLLREAARTNLTATLLALFEQDGVLEQVPGAPREHLEWARVLAARHAQAVRFEIGQIGATLAGLGLPLLLLKGAAYAAAGLPAAHGRLFSDIDILVPRARLPQVEAALMLAGWASGHHDAYDQRYYRQWMHELPPLRHVRRQSVIDVHHAILPLTAAVRPDPDKLRAAARAAGDGVLVLAPADMVLHSATHLFYDGEFDHGLRDLFDIHRLLLHFGAEPGFWPRLANRAVELELARPLFYALRYATRLLGTPVPAQALAAAECARPNPLLLALMDRLFLRALPPPLPGRNDRAANLARFLLYIRGNWLRMPPLMLSRHLFHKAFLSPRPAGATRGA